MSAKVDYLGRRYVEVPRFAAGPLKDAFAGSALSCADCATPLVHGMVRYFQRGDSTRPMITFDAICGACGDRTLARAALSSRDQPRVRTALMEIERQKVKLSIASERAIVLWQHAIASFANLEILKAESIEAIARAQHSRTNRAAAV